MNHFTNLRAEEIRLAQARVDEAEAKVGLVQGTPERADKFVASGVVSQQQGDDARAPIYRLQMAAGR